MCDRCAGEKMKKIGQGVSGAVYPTKDEKFVLKKFIKRIDSDPKYKQVDAAADAEEAAKEFQMESIHERGFQTYVVRAFQLNVDPDGTFYMVAEKAWMDLEKYADEYIYTLPKTERLPILLNVAHDCMRGLQCLWGVDFIHRDLKPPNILCFKVDTKTVAFKLGDLGLSTRKSPICLEPDCRSLLGTYPPPILYQIASNDKIKQQLWGLVDSEWIDLYSLAVSLFIISDPSQAIIAYENLGRATQEKSRLDTVKTEFDDAFTKDDLISNFEMVIHHIRCTLVGESDRGKKRRYTVEELREVMFHNPVEHDEIIRLVNARVERDQSLTTNTNYIHPDEDVQKLCESLKNVGI